MAAKNAVFAASSKKRPSIYGPGGWLKTTGPGDRRGDGAVKRSDDERGRADQKASMEMLGRRTVCKAHTILKSARKLDGPWGPGRRCGDSSPRLSISMHSQTPAVN